ncbi:Protein STIP1 [Tetrabaena socialis]|uniref:Protein STIP1 n=1 Tax=Tetrabaena socialis TaxID=47790 RepID=A0A2J8A832_9CHLO|nr:Protein STIP1 [Tetrabaena socialis]|eukprot:PNH08665.1 Protein STIP1 [Tetrabaena socialis]
MHPLFSPCKARNRSVCAAAAASQYELRVCVNRTCKRQGSEQVLKFAQDLGLPSVRAAPTGCLGNCGSGPNLVLLPNEQLLNHVATPKDLAQVLTAFCNFQIDDVLLQATQLRLAGNAHAAQLEFRQAIESYTQALELKPPNGNHMLYTNRSAVYLQSGDKKASLDDARRAVGCAPKGFHAAHVRLIDSLYALGEYGAAAEACRQAAAADSSFKFLPEYPAIKRALLGTGQTL